MTNDCARTIFCFTAWLGIACAVDPHDPPHGAATGAGSSTLGDASTTPASSTSAGDADADATSATPADSSGPTDASDGGASGDLPGRCGGDSDWPDPDWTLGDPAAHGFDPDLLEQAVDYAEGEQSYCLLVIKDGELVLERYFGDATVDTPMKSWSVAKSHVSAIVGIALQRGELGSLDDSIAQYLPELVGDPREQITLRALLSMTAGLYTDVIDDMAGMFTAPDMTAKALAATLQREPGSAWQYSNVAVQLFDPIFRSLGVRADDYAREHLWEPIGMDAQWLTDPTGNPAMYMNVIASCRDHARFGYLMLRRGCWDGEQVVPAAWVDEASAASQELNRGYGFYFWRGAGDPTLDLVDSSPLDRGALHPGAPEDAFCAVGLGSQFIEVVPSQDLVVVRMGHAAVEELEGDAFPILEIFELLGEGEQTVHDEIVQRVFAAIVG
jgi:CubicO group peptidase (beta-lactamase class C family)